MNGIRDDKKFKKFALKDDFVLLRFHLGRLIDFRD